MPSEHAKPQAEDRLSLPHSQSIRHTVDIVEPTRNQVDLQDRLIAETDGAQSIHFLRRHSPCLQRQFGSIIEHGPVSVVEWCLRVIPCQLAGKLRVK
jgi:hypothetical protein